MDTSGFSNPGPLAGGPDQTSGGLSQLFGGTLQSSWDDSLLPQDPNTGPVPGPFPTSPGGWDRGVQGEDSTLFDDPDPEDVAMEDYLMEKAWDETLTLHHDNLNRCVNKFAITHRMAEVLEEIEAEDALMNRDHDPKHYLPAWMRAVKVINDNLDQINKETREAEAEISRNANDAFQDMVNEHLEEIYAVQSEMDDDQSHSQDSYEDRDQVRGLDGRPSASQRRKELQRFKGIGLDFLTEILPGAELALPEVAEQHLEALADAEEVRLHAAAAAAEAEAESEAESEDDEEAGGAFALLGEEDEEDEEDEEEEGVDIAADLDVVDEDEEEEEEEEEEGGAFDGAEE